MKGLFFIAWLVFHGGLYISAVDYYEGSKCKNGNTSGTCTPVTNCSVALKAIHERGSHDLFRCSFEGFTEIVCCPKSAAVIGEEKPEVRGVKGARECQKACEKYQKLAKVSLSYHIVNGENADLGEFPHMAALGFYHADEDVIKFDCGGTLISNRFILTAAHCITNGQGNNLTIARLGTLNVPDSISGPEPDMDYPVSKVTIHPAYSLKEKFNDIAVIKLKNKVVSNDNVLPACLYAKDDDPLGLIVTGWGLTSIAGERSTVLQKAVLTPVALTDCNSTYLKLTQRNVRLTQICAGDDTSDSCQGDSGGPLQVQNSNKSSIFSIVGVISYGIGCGSRYPSVYTRIFSYLDWIEGIVWPQNKSSRLTVL